MAKSNKIVYVTQAQYASLITDGYITIGGVTYTYDANNTYCVREDGVEGTDILSTGATSGKVLTADGNGAASWQTGGNVSASGTLSVGSVITGLGSKSVSALNGSNGKFLGWSGGATWQGLYQHLIYATQTKDSSTIGLNFCFEIISTQSTSYTTVSGMPSGRYLAVGDVTKTDDTHCRSLYVITSGGTNGSVIFLKSDNSGIENGIMKGASVTFTDTVNQIV
jgi:hypothetical protein